MNDKKDVYFNDISLKPYCSTEEMHGRIQKFSEIIKICCTLGHRKVRYDKNFADLKISDSQTLADYCYSFLKTANLNTAISLILSTQRRPYIEPDSPQETQFIQHDYQIDIGTDNESPFGLIAAYLADSFAVAFNSSELWKKCCFSVIAEGSGKVGEVFCMSETRHFDDDDFASWYAGHNTVSYTPRCKDFYCKLSDDHGKDILTKFANKIQKEDFVEGILQSLPYNPKATDFIERIGENGVIELRLTKTKQGLGLAVKTVALNKIQTTYFAKILKEKYGG